MLAQQNAEMFSAAVVVFLMEAHKIFDVVREKSSLLRNGVRQLLGIGLAGAI